MPLGTFFIQKHVLNTWSGPIQTTVPVLLSLWTDYGNQQPRPFRFQPMWFSHPIFPGLVSEVWTGSLANAISTFTTKARIWNRDHLANIFQKKRHICARLKGIQIALGFNPSSFLINLKKSLLTDLAHIANLEAEFWSMKSRISWVVEGDRNTTFFFIIRL